MLRQLKLPFKPRTKFKVGDRVVVVDVDALLSDYGEDELPEDLYGEVFEIDLIKTYTNNIEYGIRGWDIWFYDYEIELLEDVR